MNGHPLRLVFGGWPGSTSGKWLRRISVRNVVHDGPKMGGHSYRVPCEPVEPGAAVAAEDMCIIGAMPIKSLVTDPANGVRHRIDSPLNVHGHAWVGAGCDGSGCPSISDARGGAPIFGPRRIAALGRIGTS